MAAGEAAPPADTSEPADAPDPSNPSDPAGAEPDDGHPFDPLDPPHEFDPAAPYDPSARIPLPGTGARPLVPRWTGLLLIGLGTLTVPWIARLALSLPNRVQTDHYAFSWAGFDVLLAALLLWTGWRAVRNREDIGVSAAVTAGLLVVDAWFDVTSASSTGLFLIALAMALFVELPLAAFCLWLAGRAESARRRRAARLVAMVGRLWQYRTRARRRVRPVPERR